MKSKKVIGLVRGPEPATIESQTEILREVSERYTLDLEILDLTYYPIADVISSVLASGHQTVLMPYLPVVSRTWSRQYKFLETMLKARIDIYIVSYEENLPEVVKLDESSIRHAIDSSRPEYFEISEADRYLLLQMPRREPTVTDAIDHLSALEDEILFDDHPVPSNQIAESIHLAVLMLRLAKE